MQAAASMADCRISEERMTDWKTIESAPKDGTWVLLLIPESCQDSSRPKPWVEAAHWVEEFFESWERVSETRKDRRITDRSHWSCYEDPTHWAPMPANP